MPWWYDALPAYAQNVVCDIYGLRTSRERYGDAFRSKLDYLLQSEWWSAQEIQEFRDRNVRELVRHAYDDVPFYRARMDACGLTPGDVTRESELALLPITTKEDVRRSHDQFIARTHSAAHLKSVHTSGTTGSSLHLMVNEDSIAFRWAVWWRHRMRFGVAPGEWHVNFTGKPVVPASKSKPPFWRRSRPLQQYLVNMQQLTPEHIESLASDLDAFALKFFSGYPSVIHIYCRLVAEAGLELRNPPEFVFSGAENLLLHQRRDIESVTGAILSDQYGFTEGAGNASQCKHLLYHEDFEYGVLECVDGEQLPDNSTRGRIVATGFASPGFPLLRYDVGDFGIWAPKDFRCACGRSSRVLTAIDGRVDDYVVTPEGGRVMRFDYLFKDTPNISEAQVIQEVPGEIVIKVVLRNGNAADLDVVRGMVKEWISPRLTVHFDVVNSLPRATNGKLKAVVSRLSREQREGQRLA